MLLGVRGAGGRSTSRRGAGPARPGEPHPPGFGRLALFAGGLLRDDRGARLADRRPRRPADGDAHGPAHPAARHRADPADPRPHQGAAAAGHAAAAHDRAARRIPRPPGVRGARCTPGSCGCGTSRRCTTWRCATRNIHALEHICFFAAGTSTGGTCCRRSAAACGSAAWDRSATWSAPSSWSESSGSCSRSRRDRDLPLLRRTTPTTGALSPRQDQNMAGLVMALEQSIVMGIALVCAVRADADRVRARGRARRAATKSLKSNDGARTRRAAV